MASYDYPLGMRIHEHLKSLGLETPTVEYPDGPPSNEEKQQRLTGLFKQVWETMGMDLEDDSLRETPLRMAKMYVNEIYLGLDYHNFPKITTIENKMGYDEMLCESCISVQSCCEHHGVAISGRAAVAYIPRDKVIGLSKINRVVEFFSKRPQVQERLTEQIHATLVYLLETPDVAVTISAEHFCVKSRGIQDENSFTTTSKLGGHFKTSAAVRQEFYSLARLPSPGV